MTIGRLDRAAPNRVDDKSRFVRGRFEAQFEDVNTATFRQFAEEPPEIGAIYVAEDTREDTDDE